MKDALVILTDYRTPTNGAYNVADVIRVGETAQAIKESMFRTPRPLVNDGVARAQIKSSIEARLSQLTTERVVIDFAVVCDETNNSNATYTEYWPRVLVYVYTQAHAPAVQFWAGSPEYALYLDKKLNQGVQSVLPA